MTVPTDTRLRGALLDVVMALAVVDAEARRDPDGFSEALEAFPAWKDQRRVAAVDGLGRVEAWLRARAVA